MGRFGVPELALILIIVLLLFGAAKLPQIARSVGESIKEFKKSMAGKEGKKEDNGRDTEESSKAKG